LQHALEYVARVRDLAALERFECRPPFDPGAMRGEECVQRGICLAGGDARDGRGEAISATRLRLDVLVGWLRSECLAQRGDGLLEAVVGDGDIAPGDLDQAILREDLARVRDERVQQIEMPSGDRQRLARAEQALAAGVELER